MLDLSEHNAVGANAKRNRLPRARDRPHDGRHTDMATVQTPTGPLALAGPWYSELVHAPVWTTARASL